MKMTLHRPNHGFRHETRIARHKADKKIKGAVKGFNSEFAEIFSPSFTGTVYVPGYSREQSSAGNICANMADVANSCWTTNKLMYGPTRTVVAGNPRINYDGPLVQNSIVTTSYVQSRANDAYDYSEQLSGGWVAKSSPILQGQPTAPITGFSSASSKYIATKGAFALDQVTKFWAQKDSPEFKGNLKWNAENPKHPISYAKAADIISGYAGKAHVFSPVFTGTAKILDQASGQLSGDIVPTTKNAQAIIDKAMLYLAASNDQVGHASSSWLDTGTWNVSGSTLTSSSVSQTYAELMTNSFIRMNAIDGGEQIRVKSVQIVQSPYGVTAVLESAPAGINGAVQAKVFMAGWLTVHDTNQFIPLDKAILPEGMAAPQAADMQSDFAFATTKYVVDTISLINPDEGSISGLEVSTTMPKQAGKWSDGLTVNEGTIIFSGAEAHEFQKQEFSLASGGTSPFLVAEQSAKSGWYAMYGFVKSDKKTFCALSDAVDPWSNEKQAAALNLLDAVAAQWAGSVYYDHDMGFFPQISSGDTTYYPIKQIVPTGKFVSSVMWKASTQEKSQILSAANEPFDIATPAKFLEASWIVAAAGKCVTDTRIKDYSSITQEWLRIGANIVPTSVRKFIPLPPVSTTFPAYTIPEDEMKFRAQVLHASKVDKTLARAVDTRYFRSPMPGSGALGCLVTTPLVIRQNDEQYVATPSGKLKEPNYKGWEVEWLEIAMFAVQFIPFGKCASLVGAGAGRLAARAGLAMGARAEAVVVESLLRSEIKTVAILGRNIEATTARIVAESPALPRVMVKAGEKNITAFENALIQREAVAAKEARYQFVETAYSNKNIMSTTDFSARDFMLDELGIFDDKNILSKEAQQAIFDIGGIQDVYAPGYNIYKYRINANGAVDAVVFNDDLRVRIATKYNSLLSQGTDLTQTQVDQMGKMKNALEFLEENVTNYRPADGYIVAPGSSGYGTGIGADSTATPFVENISRYQKYLNLSKDGSLAKNAIKNKEALQEYIAWAKDHNANYGTLESLIEDARSSIGRYDDIRKYVKEGMATSDFGELMFVKTMEDGTKSLNIEGNALLRSSVVGTPVSWGRLSLDQQEKVVRELWAIRFNMQRMGWGEKAYVDVFGNSGRGANYIPNTSAYPEAVLVETWDSPVLRDFELKYPADTTTYANMTTEQRAAYNNEINQVVAKMDTLMAKVGIDMKWSSDLVRGFAPYKKFRIANDLLAAQYPEALQTVNMLNTVSFKDASVLNVRTELDRAFYMSNNKVYLDATRTNIALRNAVIGRFDDGAAGSVSKYAGSDPYRWKVDIPIDGVDTGGSPFGTSGNVFDIDYSSANRLAAMDGYQELNAVDRVLLDGQRIFMDTNTATAIRNRPPVRAIPENILEDLANRAKEALWNPLISGSRRWAWKLGLVLGGGVGAFYGAEPLWDYITTPKNSPQPGDKGKEESTASTPNNITQPAPTIYDGATYDIVKNASMPAGYGRVKFTVITDSYTLPRSAISFYKSEPGKNLPLKILAPYAVGRVKKGLKVKSHHRH